MRPLVILSVSILVCEASLAAAAREGTDMTELAMPGEGFLSPRGDQAAESQTDSVVAGVRQKLVAPSWPDASQDDVDALRAYYADAEHPIWVTPAGWSPAAQAVIAELKRAGDWGLDASSFAVPALGPEASGAEGAAALADAEVGLSLAVLKYARYARGGRITDPATQLSAYLDRKPQLREPSSVIRGIAAAKEADRYLRELNPRQPQFEALRRQYLAMRDGGDTATQKVPEDGPNIVAGSTDPDVALIRERLNVPAGALQANLYDDALLDAVREFQSKNGLNVDGVIGPRTRQALNGGEKPSLKSILANMEEWRWMPDDLGDTYVWVNVPEFVVRVVKDGKVVHTAPIVVGATTTQTPIFSKDLQTLYFRPRWYIPDSIKVNEILPRLRRGGGGGYQVLRDGRPVSRSSVNWSRADARNYVIYQPSGPGNALGLVKFTFPNKHAVYMHDTPSKGLFGSKVRTFSHGCIRVKDPDQLAKVLLSLDQDMQPGEIDHLMDDGPDNHAVPLETHIPVHVTYFTTWVDENGNLASAPDVYGHEKRIALALAGKWDEIDKNAPAAVALDMPLEPEWRGPASGASPFFSPASSRPSGNTANDIFRRGFGN